MIEKLIGKIIDKLLIAEIIGKLLSPKIIKKIVRDIKDSIYGENFLKPTENLLGFHGDQYLMNLVNFFLLESSNYVETGARRGVTLKYVADGYKHLNLFSCEPNEEYFSIAEMKLKSDNKCKIYNEKSQSFIPKILDEMDLNNLTFFFLDAHGKGYKWPLRQEIEQITERLNRAIILIDDFKVPNNPQYEHDVYDGQECKISFIKDKLNSNRKYKFIYPKYKIQTSNYKHFTGYIIILMGINVEEMNIPRQLFENLSITKK